MEYLLDHKAEPDDESLHIACQNLNASAATVLLRFNASIDLPGLTLADLRTPLQWLCCKVDANVNTADLKRMLKVIADAKPNLEKLDTEGRTVIFRALDSASPLIMTKAFLTTFPSLRETLNKDYNIYRSPDGFSYSPTMYVRQFKCIRSPHSNLDRLRPCCGLAGCSAPPLEKSLRIFGCEDRYWNNQAGAKQPELACGLPVAIKDAVEEAERTRRREEAEALELR
jgi:hypothetical protein